MNKKLSELDYDEDDLTTVARFLAPHYGRTTEQQKVSMHGVVFGAVSANTSVETGGFIAVRVGDKLRFFIGNHLLRCEGVLSIKKGKKKTPV